MDLRKEQRGLNGDVITIRIQAARKEIDIDFMHCCDGLYNCQLMACWGK